MNLQQFKEKVKYKEEELTVTFIDSKSSKKLKFDIINETTLWRAETLFSKEPETIQWIRNFKPNSIFYDIGANVGMYSIFAAINNKKNKIYSFEPHAGNFMSLVKNININNVSKTTFSFPVALSNKTKFTILYLDNMISGDSGHCLENSLDHNLNKINLPYQQNSFTTSLDDLIGKWKFPIPNYVKIDVDGLESKIILGAKNLIKNKKLFSVLIEINPEREKDKDILKFFKKNNFIFDEFETEKFRKKSGWNKGYANYIFFRN